MLNDECLLAFFFKNIKKEYSIGNDPTNVSDFYTIIPKNTYDVYVFPVLTITVTANSIVLYRNRDILPFILSISILLMLLAYLWVLHNGSYISKHIINETLKILIVIIITYYTINRFNLISKLKTN